MSTSISAHQHEDETHRRHTSSPRVLILSTDLGGGHDALAAGLRDELLARDPHSTVHIDNGVRSASTELSELAREGYKLTVERQPWIFQLWYWVLSATALARIARWMAWRSLRRAVVAQVEEFRPDVVVSTYPFLTAVLGKLRREGQLDVPAVGLLIDSGPHDVWLAPGIDMHVAMNPADCERARAVWPGQPYYPPLQITTARPAVDARCREPHDRQTCRAQFDLPIDQCVLLVSGGSWGLALPDDVLLELLRETDVHLAIACGSNDELRSHLAELLPKQRATVLGFTREMPSLLAACDAALLNAGGMTCHECFALGTPVLLYEPLAGHGRSAARALDEDRLATWVRSHDELVAAVREIGSSTELADRAKRAAALSDQPPLAEVVLATPARELPAGEALTTRVIRSVSRRLHLAIGAMVAVGVAAALWTQREAAADFSWQLSGVDLAMVLLLFAVGPITQAVAFWLLLRLTGVASAGLGSSLAVWSWSALARYTPGSVMLFVVRVREGSRLGATRLQVLAASIYEQWLAVAGAAMLSAFAFMVAVGEPPGVVTALAVVAVVAVVALRPRLLGGWLLRRTSLAQRGLGQLPRGRGMALVLALNAAGWVAVGSGAAIAVDGLAEGPSVDASWVIAVYSFAWLVGFVSPFAPGGIGVREAVFASFLAASHGVGVAAGLAIGLRLVHTVGDLLASAVIELGYRATRTGSPREVLRQVARARER